jgi:hypothetical protein
MPGTLPLDTTPVRNELLRYRLKRPEDDPEVQATPAAIPHSRVVERIFDPWPPNVGAIDWENFNTTIYSTNYAMYTLERKTTNHT